MNKSEIAPKGISFSSGDFVISDRYATILTVVGYPKYVSTGYLSGLANIAGVKMVAKHAPIPYTDVAKMLNKQLVDLKLKYQDERDATVQEQYRQDIQSLEYFISLITANQSRIFDFQLHLFVSAESKEQLEIKKMQVNNFLGSLEMKGFTLRFEQEQVLKSILSVFPKQGLEDRIGTPIPSVTLAAMYPFVFDSLKDGGLATLLGVDYSGGVVLFNQFLYQLRKETNRNNANMIILGTSGSGKSTAAKIVLRGHLRNGFKLVLIDPEDELQEMVRLYGGDAIDLGKGGDFGMINPLEILVEADEEDIAQGLGYAVLTQTLQFLKAFMKYYDPSVTEDVLALFIELTTDTYKRFGISETSDFSKYSSRDYPTLSDVYATVKGKLLSIAEKTREKDILESLELKLRPLVKELRYYFDGHTTVNPQTDFIVFNIKELMNSDVNVRNALFFNILKYAWSQCLDKSINTVLMVDEAHVLLSGGNDIGANFLAQVQRRARKYNTGSIIITQQPSDFSDPSVITQGKAIFDNAAYYLVMGLKKQAVEDLSKLIDLNDNEKEEIKHFSQGEALFVCGHRRMRINVVATRAELDSFGEGGGL